MNYEEKSADFKNGYDKGFLAAMSFLERVKTAAEEQNETSIKNIIQYILDGLRIEYFLGDRNA